MASLEQESEYLTLTKKQREKIKKRSLHRYHDLGERVYTSEEMEELYGGVSVPKEIIMEEIARVKPQIKAPKVTKEKRQYSGSLETSIIKEDLEKFGQGALKAGRGILKTITYPTMGVSFALPTMIRKALQVKNWDNGVIAICAAGMFLFDSFWGYLALAQTNPKAILPVALTQIGTNLASGIYEYVRHVRKKMESE